MKVTLLLLLTILATHLSAHTGAPAGLRKRCSPAPAPENPRTLEQLQPVFEANNIEILEGSSVTPANVEKFLAEYNKIPQSLREEMISRKAGIRLMEGSGVGIDSSLQSKMTVEGTREWIDVPGAGGLIERNRNIPTRLAINHLYDKHGASNLVLHEHAHTLDSIYGEHALSSTPVFRSLLTTPGAPEFLGLLCGKNYCAPDKPVEAFAELFSYYYACEETRTHMEEAVPQIAEFFRNFKSGRDLLNGEIPGWTPKSTYIRGRLVVNNETPKEEECDTSPTSDFTASIGDFTAVTQKLNEKYPAPPVRSEATSVSAAGMQ